jgi:uncharacterized protein YajQ (UPF0234 family)
MMTLINDAQHWRDRAEEARVIANGMHDQMARRQIFAIAEGYGAVRSSTQGESVRAARKPRQLLIAVIWILRSKISDMR